MSGSRLLRLVAGRTSQFRTAAERFLEPLERSAERQQADPGGFDAKSHPRPGDLTPGGASGAGAVIGGSS
jgi:hypothetical protein